VKKRWMSDGKLAVLLVPTWPASAEVFRRKLEQFRISRDCTKYVCVTSECPRVRWRDWAIRAQRPSRRGTLNKLSRGESVRKSCSLGPRPTCPGLSSLRPVARDILANVRPSCTRRSGRPISLRRTLRSGGICRPWSRRIAISDKAKRGGVVEWDEARFPNFVSRIRRIPFWRSTSGRARSRLPREPKSGGWREGR